MGVATCTTRTPTPSFFLPFSLYIYSSIMAAQIIASEALVVFSKSYCPYCNSLKRLLSDIGAKAHILELDQIPEGGALQNEFASSFGQRTVPAVFLSGKLLGGNDNVQALHRSGDLEPALKAAGVI